MAHRIRYGHRTCRAGAGSHPDRDGRDAACSGNQAGAGSLASPKDDSPCRGGDCHALVGVTGSVASELTRRCSENG